MTTTAIGMGRSVHYVMDGECRAAIVTVGPPPSPAECTHVSLYVITRNSTHHLDHVAYDPDMDTGTWHWYIDHTG